MKEATTEMGMQTKLQVVELKVQIIKALSKYFDTPDDLLNYCHVVNQALGLPTTGSPQLGCDISSAETVQNHPAAGSA